MKLSSQAKRNIRAAMNEAGILTAQGALGPNSRSRLTYLEQYVSTAQLGLDPGPLVGRPPERRMDESTGSWVPQQFFYEWVFQSMADTDPLLDDNNVTIATDDAPDPDSQQGSTTKSAPRSPLTALSKFRPKKFGAWDLSEITSTLVNETEQIDLIAQPNISGKVTKPYIHAAGQWVSMEFEQDTGFPILELMAMLFGVGFARGVGASVVSGSGVNQPTGILTGATDSGYTTDSSGVLSLADFQAIYFKLDRFYRNRPKCAWLMDDTTYQAARLAVDDNHRPLLSVERDEERIMGKRVLVSPSMPSASGTKGIVFGDLSNMVVYLGSMQVGRAWDRPNAVDQGRALWSGRMRVDSFVTDPSNGTKPPIIYAKLA